MLENALIKEDGLGFPIEDCLANVYEDRKWHSYVTYVQLK